MRIIIPKDWHSNPQFIKKLESDGKLKVFGETIHAKWKGLTRRFDQKRFVKIVKRQVLSFRILLSFPVADSGNSIIGIHIDSGRIVCERNVHNGWRDD